MVSLNFVNRDTIGQKFRLTLYANTLASFISQQQKFLSMHRTLHGIVY